MLFMLVIPVIGVVALAHRYLQIYAPSNVLIRRVNASAPRWRIAAGLAALAAALIVAMHALTGVIGAGAPGWLNLVGLLLGWDGIKVGCLAVGVGVRAIGVACRGRLGRGVESVPQASYSFEPPRQVRRVSQVRDRWVEPTTVGRRR